MELGCCCSRHQPAMHTHGTPQSHGCIKVLSSAGCITLCLPGGAITWTHDLATLLNISVAAIVGAAAIALFIASRNCIPLYTYMHTCTHIINMYLGAFRYMCAPHGVYSYAYLLMHTYEYRYLFVCIHALQHACVHAYMFAY